MKIAFTKMRGAGNDFVMIENLDGKLRLSEGQIASLCHRRFGVGADGLMLLEQPSKEERRAHSGLDARMVYFNSDGSRADMCGNGARCFASFALKHKLGSGRKVRFLTDAGVITATRKGGSFTIQMTPARDIRLGVKLALKAGKSAVHHLNTGVPHAVRFVEDVSKVEIRPEGAELRFHKEWGPKGANANFVQIRGKDEPLLVRTYERGVEDETLACGTGVTASALAAHLAMGVELPVRLQVAGGDVLEVDAKVAKRRGKPVVTEVTLTGPAAVVFRGSVKL